MCLISDLAKTEALKKEQGPFIRYKVITKERKSIFYNHEWQLGWNISNAYQPYTYGPVTKGIHVYINYHAASREVMNWDYVIVIKVLCYIEDLIAVGNHSESSDIACEAYTKVFVESFDA